MRITGISSINFRAGFSTQPSLDLNHTIEWPLQGTAPGAAPAEVGWPVGTPGARASGVPTPQGPEPRPGDSDHSPLAHAPCPMTTIHTFPSSSLSPFIKSFHSRERQVGPVSGQVRASCSLPQQKASSSKERHPMDVLTPCGPAGLAALGGVELQAQGQLWDRRSSTCPPRLPRGGWPRCRWGLRLRLAELHARKYRLLAGSGSELLVWEIWSLSWGHSEDFAGTSSEERWGGTWSRLGTRWTTEQ